MERRKHTVVWLVTLLLVLISLCWAQGPKFQTLEYGEEFEEQVDEEFEGEIIQENIKTREGHGKTEYDDDEFVGFKQQQKSSETKDGNIKNDNEGQTAQIVKEIPARSYYIELVYVILLMGYGINYLFGRKTNEDIAKAWGLQFGKLFNQHFSKVGENALLSKESQSCFRLTATGRRNCLGLQATLELQKRHELFSLLLGLISPSEDKLIVEVPMNADAMPSFVFAVLESKSVKRYSEENPDLSLYAATVEHALSAEGLSVLTDCAEIVPILLHPDVLATIKKYRGYFVSMHFTDQSKTPRQQKLLRFVYRLPAKNSMDELKTLLRMALHFVDLIGRTKLSQQAKARAEKKRSKVAEAVQKSTHAQRQEAAQQRKLEKIQAEKKRVAALSEEQQRKLEIKEQKRAMKKRMPVKIMK